MKELLDTYDIAGVFIGVQTREFCHTGTPNCYHKAVWILARDITSGKILVHKISENKKENAGKWGECAAAGHVDAGEKCITACVRETYEELGIKAKKKDFVFLGEWRNYDAWEYGQVYLLNYKIDLKKIKFDKNEIEEIKLVDLKEFEELCFSENFCYEPAEYKTWIIEELKNFNSKK